MTFLKYKSFTYIVSFCYLLFSNNCIAQGIGNGNDGSPNISGIVNSYTYLINDAHKCDDVLFVANANQLNSNDLILIIQMQGAEIDTNNAASYGSILSYNNTGNYEFAKITSVTGNKLSLKFPLTRNYSISGKVQIIKVPQYKSPKIIGTLTCLPWNGTTGGVLAIDAQDTIFMNNYINVMGKGFRGGIHHDAQHIFDIRYEYFAESPDPRYYALKGEGIAFYGVAPYTSGRGAPASGGGGGNIHTTGGGGGSNFGCGGDGGWGYPVDTSGGEKIVFGIGGHSLSYSNTQNKVFLGGGGGSGHEHFGNGTSGANGGGIVFITSKAIDGNGFSIFARGNNSASGGAYGDGVGGAGGGGSVLLSINDYLSKINVDVSGGSGGSTIAIGFGPGGGGGGGCCWVSSTSLPDSATVQIPGGLKGVAGGTVYGGSDGCNGGVLTSLKIPFNISYPSVSADFSMSPTFLTLDNTSFTDHTNIIFTNLSTGGTFSNWDYGDGTSDTIINPIHTYSYFGTYLIQLAESNELCSDTITKIISTEFDIPNVFTPNGDGNNDFFPGIDFNYSSSITIFNRWGKEVFSGTDNQINWDGTTNNKEVPSGTYFYIIKLINPKNKDFILEGSVTLLK